MSKSTKSSQVAVRAGAGAADPILKMRSVMAEVVSGTTGDVNDVLRTADALSTTWNRLANNTQRMRSIADVRAAKILAGK